MTSGPPDPDNRCSGIVRPSVALVPVDPKVRVSGGSGPVLSLLADLYNKQRYLMVLINTIILKI